MKKMESGFKKVFAKIKILGWKMEFKIRLHLGSL